MAAGLGEFRFRVSLSSILFSPSSSGLKALLAAALTATPAPKRDFRCATHPPSKFSYTLCCQGQS